MAVGHPSINQCSNIRLRPIRQTHSLLAMQTSEEGEVKQQLEVRKCSLDMAGGRWGFPKRPCQRSRVFCKSGSTWLEVEPSQLIYFEPVGTCSLWGSAHILHFSHKQMKHLSTPVKGMAAVSVTNVVYHEIVSHGELYNLLLMLLRLMWDFRKGNITSMQCCGIHLYMFLCVYENAWVGCSFAFVRL